MPGVVWCGGVETWWVVAVMDYDGNGKLTAKNPSRNDLIYLFLILSLLDVYAI